MESAVAEAMPDLAKPPPIMIKVWDPLVRIFHWTVALGVIANLTVLREREEPHTYLGYLVVAAVVVRLSWGFIARGHARFSAFVPGAPGLLRYLRQMVNHTEPRYVGHNPAGGAMIVLLMTLVSLIGLTGWMMSLDQFWGVAWVEFAHKAAANIITGAAVIHVLGAIVESHRHRENLPLAMITGYKRMATGKDIDRAPPAR